jgi:MFS superfamily sulfate permease-like transporter
LTALAAMLIYTGYRLASPKQLFKTYLIGKEQLLIFLTTIFVTVSTDLLIGIASGILMKFFIHLYLGLPVKSIFKPLYRVDQPEHNTYLIRVNQSAVFANYIQLKKKLDELPRKAKIFIDFNNCNIIDHTVMEHLHVYKQEYENEGGILELIGLQNHKKLSDHPLAVHVKKSM